MNALDTLRSEYRTIRAACTWLSAKVFDSKCACLAHELADGEDITPSHWVRAAREIGDPTESMCDAQINDLEYRDG